MNVHSGSKFAQKHGPNAKPDESIKTEILKLAKTDQLPCAVAFEIAKILQVSPDAVGRTADLMNFKLTKCQLGLFGYQPQKKMVEPLSHIQGDLKDAITGSLAQGKLSCERAWNIATRLGVRKMTVSCACEAMGIKITECQLGAF